jgi:diguanylate cyclase (GGDEF)-like protein
MNELALAAERFAILDHAPLGQLVVRADLTVLFWNRCLELWTGRGRDQVVGCRLDEIYPHLAAPKYLGRIRNVLAGGAPAIFSPQLHPYLIPAPLPGGKCRAQYSVVTWVPDYDSAGGYAVIAIQDVTSLTEAIASHRQLLEQLLAEMNVRRQAEEALLKTTMELKRLNRSLRQRSITDGLTGLYNHRYFFQVLKRDFSLALRAGSDYACVILDLDHFKGINDSWGHPFGDKVLKGIGKVLLDRCRKSDLVARYGGEEFALLLPESDLDGALDLAESIRARIAARAFRHDGVIVHVTASIGIATLRSQAANTPQELLSAADNALYRAKASGRNCIHIATANNGRNLIPFKAR